MEWIEYQHNQMRSDIETREDFIKRNIQWWKINYKQERTSRKPYYDRFLELLNVKENLMGCDTIGEVGAGPFGGILENCSIPAIKYVHIDYIMKELYFLKFISWPDNCTYVDSPAEDIPLPDNYIDALLSYNCLDHGWDTRKSVRECIRISKKCFLSFDCRGDNPLEIERRRRMGDKDHYEALRVCDMESDLNKIEGIEIKRFFATKFNKEFPTVFIYVEKKKCLDQM